MTFYKVLVFVGILSYALASGLQAQEVALADDKVDPVSEVFDIYADLLERHLVEKDLENDGLATAFDYQGALKRDDAMDLLDRQIYTPKNVDDLLTENTRRAFNTHRHLHVEGDALYVSSLFDWYKADFEREEGSAGAFIRKYADARVIEMMDRTEQMRFIDYDWTLNAPENFPEFK